MDMVYIRKCYLTLFEMIMAREKTSGIHICGSPGIGKSYFLWYVLWRLLQKEDHPHIFVEQTGKIYLFRTGGIGLVVSDINRCGEYGIRGTTWMLIDQKFRDHSTRRNILFASPRRSNWKWLEKEAGGFETMYMPVWSFQELFLVWSKMDVSTRFSEEVLKDKFFVAGGIARDVFTHPLEELETKLSAGIKMTVTETGTKIVANLVGHMAPEDERASHRVYCLRVNAAFNGAKLNYVSDAAAQLVAAGILTRGIDAWKAFLVDAKGMASLSTIYDRVFEQVGHLLMVNGGTMTVKFLGDKERFEKVDFEKKRVHYLATIGELGSLSIEELYIRPISDVFAGIDGICCDKTRRVFCINLTINSKHKINVDCIREVEKHLGSDAEKWLTWGVPLNILKDKRIAKKRWGKGQGGREDSPMDQASLGLLWDDLNIKNIVPLKESLFADPAVEDFAEAGRDEVEDMDDQDD